MAELWTVRQTFFFFFSEECANFSLKELDWILSEDFFSSDANANEGRYEKTASVNLFHKCEIPAKGKAEIHAAGGVSGSTQWGCINSTNLTKTIW